MTIPAPIRDELRKAMAIHALYKLYRKGQMKLKDQHAFLEEVFHGNNKTGVVSQVYQVVNGLPPFNLLYTTQTELVVNANIDSSTNIKSLVLRNDLSQSESVLIAGRDITQIVLERTSFTGPSLMKGRKLLNDANNAFRHIRKALAILHQMPEVSFVGNEIQYNSGVSVEEVKEKLLDGMYDLLNNKPAEPGINNEVDGEGDDDTSVVISTRNPSPTRPKGWLFPGWMALIMFGPFAESRNRLDLIEIADNGEENKAGNNSRKALRKERAEEKGLKREYCVDKYNGDCKRGVSMAHQISMQALEIKNRELAIKEREANNINMGAQILNLQLQLGNT
jgi:hypothetical protein